MESKKTVVLGASDRHDRYSYLAAVRLRAYGHEVVAIGNRTGKVADVNIITEHPEMNDVDTVTLYLNPTNQKPYYDYILSLHPKRVIFNPGTENEELENKLKIAGIKPMEACTLVMLGTGQY